MEETKFPQFPHVVIIGDRTGRDSPRLIGEEEEKGKRLIKRTPLLPLFRKWCVS